MCMLAASFLSAEDSLSCRVRAIRWGSGPGALSQLVMLHQMWCICQLAELVETYVHGKWHSEDKQHNEASKDRRNLC